MTKKLKPLENLDQVIYTTQSARSFYILEMSKGFIQEQISYITKTGIGIQKLPLLKEALRQKSIIQFKYIG